MAGGLLGKKLGMTRVFDSQGRVVPVTLIEAGPCYVLQVKTVATDGYNAIRLGFGVKSEKHTKRPEMGLIEKVNRVAAEGGEGAQAAEEQQAKEGKGKRADRPEPIRPPRFIREIRVPDPDNYRVGQRLDVGIFEVGEKVDIVGTSKGRGFAGTVKRFGTKRGPETHGSRYHRRPGSLGASAFPSRVFKGKGLPGHMGNRRTTIRNLTVVETDAENNLLAVKGSVPGHVNAYVIIRKNTLSRKG